ncbi:MAG: 3-dehydroquinate synthase, partial [Ignavibacteria bacterium]|nr:3-dehydroquinate synthase [Ignavibacteria bacterium]
YKKVIEKDLKNRADKFYILKLTAGEKLKSQTTVNSIYKVLLKENFGRDTLIIAIGGGTIGDTAGFVASTFMRGVQLVHIPTTLLAAVDSSIGGKTGVNFSNAKNIIGTFYQPSLVLIDTNFFKSLSEDDMVSGVGEIIKYGIISDESFYKYIHSNFSSIFKLKSSVIDKIVYDSVKLKVAVVSEDEFDNKGLRKILNFGHTFAHAFESYYKFKFNHGRTVTAGIVAALCLSNRKEIISNAKLRKLLQLPLKLKTKKLIGDFNSSKIIEMMKLDKKNKWGELNFVLLKNIGEMYVDVRVNKRDIKYALEETKKILL